MQLNGKGCGDGAVYVSATGGGSWTHATRIELPIANAVPSHHGAPVGDLVRVELVRFASSSVTWHSKTTGGRPPNNRAAAYICLFLSSTDGPHCISEQRCKARLLPRTPPVDFQLAVSTPSATRYVASACHCYDVWLAHGGVMIACVCTHSQIS